MMETGFTIINNNNNKTSLVPGCVCVCVCVVTCHSMCHLNGLDDNIYIFLYITINNPRVKGENLMSHHRISRRLNLSDD
jgi:hypothetical protein